MESDELIEFNKMLYTDILNMLLNGNPSELIKNTALDILKKKITSSDPEPSDYEYRAYMVIYALISGEDKYLTDAYELTKSMNKFSIEERNRVHKIEKTYYKVLNFLNGKSESNCMVNFIDDLIEYLDGEREKYVPKDIKGGM